MYLGGNRDSFTQEPGTPYPTSYSDALLHFVAYTGLVLGTGMVLSPGRSFTVDFPFPIYD